MDREVRVVDMRGLVHLHVVGATNTFKCRLSVYVPGMHRGPVRTQRPLSCFWCIAGRRYK